MSFRDDDEFDPQTFAVGGGLPGMLWRAMQQQNQQQAANSDAISNAAAPGNNADGSPRDVLPGRPQAIVQPGKPQPEAISVATPNGGAEFRPYAGSQGASFDWLRSSQMQQEQYRPPPTDGIDYDVLARLIQGHESANRPNAKKIVQRPPALASLSTAPGSV
jgi:hypothetical protein